MALFNKLAEPIVLRESERAKAQVKLLEEEWKNAAPEQQSKLEQEIKMLSYGIYGEDNILFELKNSHMPMYILHDLCLQQEDLTAQIDFLIITRKLVFVVECKNLIGNIEITKEGSFIRHINYSGAYKKEGIYSPITQNIRHMELLKKVRREAKQNILSRVLFDKYFYENYRSVVVLANPKTVLNAKYAQKEIRDKVIRADQLIAYMKEANQKFDRLVSSDKEMEELAHFFLKRHMGNQPNNTQQVATDTCLTPLKTTPASFGAGENMQSCTHSTVYNLDKESSCYKRLKDYRLQKSRKEGHKPYFIFNDSQMAELIQKRPRTIEQLKCIHGFGQVKCEKYGKDIIAILQNEAR